jgi:CHAD domain-containing protein
MLDRGWIEAGGRREAISELEIEMAQGDTAAVFEVALALVRDLPLRPAILSKAERGYRLACGSVPRPVKAAASSLSAEQTPLAAFRSVVAACIVQLQMNELGANSDDPEFVHQMRVALRRLRAALRAFQPALPPEFVETLLPPPLAHVRALARVLGEARDWDVLATEVVAPAQAAFAGDGRLAALRDAVEAQRRQAREAARLALAAREHAGFLLGFSAMLERLAAVPDSISLIGFSKRRLSKLHKKLLALAAAAQQGQADSASLHALRIAAKRFRYAMEFFAPLHDRKEVGAALELLTELQDTIGSLNDLANAGARLMRCAGEEPALREALALLGGWHGPRHAALRARLPRLMRALTESPRYWR